MGRRRRKREGERRGRPLYQSDSGVCQDIGQDSLHQLAQEGQVGVRGADGHPWSHPHPPPLTITRDSREVPLVGVAICH